MKKLAYIVVLLFHAFFVEANGERGLLTLENESFYSNTLRQEVKYSVCLPESYYESEVSYPVVYLLHGLGDNSSSWLEYGNISIYAGEAVRQKRIVPMIFVMPEGYRTYYVDDYYGKFLYQDMFINELIPHIDHKYRTKKDKSQRATLGYSMGGFGALMMAVKNQDVFSVTVPLSISVRTDEQYKEELSPEWDEQWGRLFGGMGKKGEERLTDYYRQYSPFHVFKQGFISNLKIYIDNGDDEYSLARSNEELHMLMRKNRIPHEFRVRNGGHDFEFWQGSLYNGLNFISDAFEGKPYRGDKENDVLLKSATLTDLTLGEYVVQASFPSDYDKGNRLYPVLYVCGNFNKGEKEIFSGITRQLIDNVTIPPLIIVFLGSSADGQHIEKIIDLSESVLRARQGWRFRSLLGYRDGGRTALGCILKKEMFSCIASFDATVNAEDYMLGELKNLTKKDVERTWLYLDAPDKGSFYEANGMLHILMREKDIYHEYRVRQGNGDFGYLTQGLEGALKFIMKKIHR